MIKILFICHGNICRSPMAEFIFKDMLVKNHMENDFVVASAATSMEEIWNGIGNPVYPPARDELRKHGLSCEGKRAVQVLCRDYETYDYLICMDRQNIRNLLRIVGADKEQKISLIMDYTNRKGTDVSDPWYTGDFGTAYRDIEEGCRGLLAFLLRGKSK